MIDLHTHILPGLDDGPHSPEAALAMAARAAAYGVTTIVATPHVMPGVYDNPPGRILEAVDRLNKRLEAGGVAVRVLPGAEYYFDDDLPRRLARGELLTINRGSCLLLEFPGQSVPLPALRVLFDLLMAGVRPVLAHPERNAVLAQKPDLVYDLVSRGVLLQVTAASLVGGFGRTAALAAELYVRQGWAQLIASDAHNPGERITAMGGVKGRITALAGTETAALLTRHNPRAVLDGDMVTVEAAPPPGDRDYFPLWRRLLK
ncbi:MAG: phosphotransferase [Candidatus Desulforudis sp.]|nr:phosphotransferase [Desulforudis sp.]